MKEISLLKIEGCFKKRKGYTLPQLLVVLGVLVILIAFGMIGSWVMDYSREVKTKNDMQTIVTGLKAYKTMCKTGQYPTNLGLLISGIPKDKSTSNREVTNIIENPNANWTSDPSSFCDAWDEPYTYDVSSKTLTSNNNGSDPIVFEFGE